MAVGTLKTSTPSILSLDEIKRRLTPIFKKYQVRRAYLFGSYARGEATPESDVDIRVEKGDNDCLCGLLEESGMYLDLKDAVGREVDLLTHYPKSIYSRIFRKNMERDEIVIYDDK
jgi:hypothetical protein